jgi:hypothetical protein
LVGYGRLFAGCGRFIGFGLFGDELRTLGKFGVLPTNPRIAFSHFRIGHPTEVVTQVIMDKLE